MSKPRLTTHPSMNLFLFLLLAILWSGSFINIKIVVDALPPVFCAMMRVLISFVCLGIFFTLTGKKIFLPSLQCWRLWMAGLFTQGLPFLLLFFGEKFVAPALASILNSTTSIWALLLGTLIFRDFSQWTALKVTGLALGFGGIVLIFYPFLQGNDSSLIGITAIMGMAISYAIGGLINQHLIFKTQKVSFESNLFQQHLSSLLLLLIVSLSFETWPAWHSVIDMKVLPAFLYLGVIATALAWMIYFYLIREWGSVGAASVMYVVPVLALLWDFLFLHLTPSQNELIGAGAILLGVVLIQWKRRLRKSLSLSS